MAFKMEMPEMPEKKATKGEHSKTNERVSNLLCITDLKMKEKSHKTKFLLRIRI
jgi:hypothetical protein